MIASISLTAFAATALAATGFVFSTPPGWSNLSPGALNANAKQVPPQLAKFVADSHFAFYAADVNHAGDGFPANVNVVVNPGVPEVSEKMLAETTKLISAELAKQGAGNSFTVIDQKVLDWNGVKVGRTVGELVLGGQHLKQVSYLLPGHGEHAVVTYSTSPPRFAADEPVFDKAARATVGLEQQRTAWEKIGRSAARGAIVAAFAVTLVSLLVTIRRRKTEKT
jgi:hypothetical protein